MTDPLISIKSKEQESSSSAGWVAWDPTVTGFTGTVTKDCRYIIIGKLFIFNLYVSGTSNSTSFEITLPITTPDISNYTWTGACGNIWDNGAVLTAPGRYTVTNNSSTMVFRTDMGTGAWTAANNKSVRVTGMLGIA